MRKQFRIFLLLMVIFTMSFFTASADPRIIGGTEADQGEFPFIAYIGKYHNGQWSTFCGGTLISSKWVVTAAHCMEEYDSPAGISLLRIVTGSNTFDTSKAVTVSDVIVHSSYNSFTDDNDIALIELSEDVTAAPVDFLSTASAPYYITGTLATVAGWGDTDPSLVDTYPDYLMKANVPIVSHEVCSEAYNGDITDNMLCAGYTDGGYDACQGDSGGPLFVENQNGTNTFIGVVSFGEGCAEPGYPGVYAKLQNYETWIETNTGLDIIDGAVFGGSGGCSAAKDGREYGIVLLIIGCAAYLFRRRLS